MCGKRTADSMCCAQAAVLGMVRTEDELCKRGFSNFSCKGRPESTQNSVLGRLWGAFGVAREGFGPPGGGVLECSGSGPGPPGRFREPPGRFVDGPGALPVPSGRVAGAFRDPLELVFGRPELLRDHFLKACGAGCLPCPKIRCFLTHFCRSGPHFYRFSIPCCQTSSGDLQMKIVFPGSASGGFSFS